MYEIPFGVIIIIAIIVFLIKNSESLDSFSDNQKSEDKIPPIFKSGDQKPSEHQIENFLGNEKFQLYKLFTEKLKVLGTPDLLWRGSENGWVLTTKESEGKCGSVIISRFDYLTGQTGTFSRSAGQTAVDKIPLKNENDIIDFYAKIAERINI